MKVILYIAIGLVLLSGGALLWRATRSASKQQTSVETQRAKNERIVRDYYRKEIESAKEQGKNEVLLPGAFDLPTPELSLEELLRDYGLLRVKVIDKETTVTEPDARIRTWYKVKIVETLHHQSMMIKDEPLPDEAPSRFLPLLPSESLMVSEGGVITVDGVFVVRGVSTDDVLFIPKQEYLIIAYLNYGGKLIQLGTGRAGVFQVKNTHFKSFGEKEHRLVREMEERHGNDLDRLRSNVH
jgi:hypothetical protein